MKTRIVVVVAILSLCAAAFFLMKRESHRVSSSTEEMKDEAREPAADVKRSNDRPEGRAPHEARTNLPPQGTPLAKVVDQLEARAMAGEPHAACRLSQDIKRCTNIELSLEMAEVFARLPKQPGREESFSEELLKQADGDAGFCSGVKPKTLASGYAFQSKAADSGDRDLERWLVLAPDLDQQDFLSDIDAWQDYRRRAARYVRRALDERDGSDFQLLLAVYATGDIRSPRPVYRVDDRATFLALLGVATKNKLAVPTTIQELADRVEKELTPEEKSRVAERAIELGNGWTFPARQKFVSERIVEYQGDSFCR